MTNGVSGHVKRVFSPGDKVFTKTGKPFVIEEIEPERIRFRLLSSGRKMSLKQSRLASVIDNFEEIRNSDNLEHAVNVVLRKFGDSDSANEPYLYGLAQEFWKRQGGSAPKTKSSIKIVPRRNANAARPKVRSKSVGSKPHVDPAQFDFSNGAPKR